MTALFRYSEHTYTLGYTVETSSTRSLIFSIFIYIYYFFIFSFLVYYACVGIFCVRFVTRRRARHPSVTIYIKNNNSKTDDGAHVIVIIFFCRYRRNFLPVRRRRSQRNDQQSSWSNITPSEKIRLVRVSNYFKATSEVPQHRDRFSSLS